MKFPIPTRHYDDSGCTARLTSAIHRAGSDLHDIANRDSNDESELLDAADAVADELARARDVAIDVTIINEGMNSGSVTSLSTLVAILDAGAYVAQVKHSVHELREGDPSDGIKFCLHDIAGELYCHDHAKSTADWIAAAI